MTWQELLEKPATAEVSNWGSMRVVKYATLAEAIAFQVGSTEFGYAYVCNITAADGTIWKEDTNG